MIKISFAGSHAYIQAILAATALVPPDHQVGGLAPPSPQVYTPPQPPGPPPAADEGDGPTNANAPAADALGIPWDERIHSKNKGMNADNTWRKKRGVTAELVQQVENELKARGAQGAGMYMLPPGAPQTFTPPPGPAGQQMQQPMQFVQPPVPPPPQQPQFVQPPAAAPTGPMDMQQFMQHLSGQMQKPNPAGGVVIDPNYLQTVVQRTAAHMQVAFNTITDIASNPNAVQTAIWFMTQDGRW